MGDTWTLPSGGDLRTWFRVIEVQEGGPRTVGGVAFAQVVTVLDGPTRAGSQKAVRM